MAGHIAPEAGDTGRGAGAVAWHRVDAMGEARAPVGRMIRPRNGPVGAAAVRPRVMLVASAGGHWIELSRLSSAFAGCDCRFVSTAPGMTAPVGDAPVQCIRDSSRDTLPAMVRTAFEIWRIVRRERPEVVVSTGAAPGAIALVAAKLLGARTIWIDSIANGDELSMSGRAIRPFADLRLTQWEHLTHRYGHLRYFGQIL
ncbi:glucuronosyltransferase [Sphingomonas sp. VNH70]|uniref:glucuronosyltransferase n=1 Tax=Sphingomonas silueang TaxID=3156617 RepID=UPI0032B36A01